MSWWIEWLTENIANVECFVLSPSGIVDIDVPTCVISDGVIGGESRRGENDRSKGEEEEEMRGGNGHWRRVWNGGVCIVIRSVGFDGKWGLGWLVFIDIYICLNGRRRPWAAGCGMPNGRSRTQEGSLWRVFFFFFLTAFGEKPAQCKCLETLLEMFTKAIYWLLELGACVFVVWECLVYHLDFYEFIPFFFLSFLIINS